MTYHEQLLTQREPLERHEIVELQEWASVLKEDCELFGPTVTDLARIAMIEARVAREIARAA